MAGGLDAACGTLGAGVFENGQTQEQGGQAGGMSICLDHPLAHKKLILSPHVVPGKWLLQGGSVGGGGTLKWFKQELGEEKSFDELTLEAAKVAPGSDGVIFLPYMAGAEVGVLNAMGGAANSILWTQIKADVTGRTIQVPESDTATTLGAAILAGIGCGIYKDYREAVESTIKINRIQKPDMKNHELYNRCMEHYLELYKVLKDSFKAF